MRSLLGVSIAAGLASGCLEDPSILLPDDTEQVKAEVFEVPQISPPPLDLLIVVDNSAQMAAYEASLADDLDLLGGLVEENSGWWDRHIGVVTADVGCTQRPAWRPAPLTNGVFFIDWRHLDNTRTKNFDGSLADHLPGVLAAGHEGCGAHRPLDAIVAAIDPATGFRRANADLVVLILSASDDASLVSVDDAMDAIARSSNAPRSDLWWRVRVAAFAPPQSARLSAFAEAVQDERQSRLVPIGSPDMLSILQWFRRLEAWGVHCLQSPAVDLDPAPGLQARCSISDVVRDRTTDEVVYDRVLPACTGANRPCWRMEARPAACSQGPGYGLQIDRIDFPPVGTIASGQCEIIETPNE